MARVSDRSLGTRVGVAVMLTVVVAGSRQGRAGGVNVTRGCVEHFDAAADYFPDKATVEDAANFSVAYQRSYKVITTREDAGGQTEHNCLVQCGTPDPP